MYELQLIKKIKPKEIGISTQTTIRSYNELIKTNKSKTQNNTRTLSDTGKPQNFTIK